jgi:hypothetical protein
VNLLDLSLAQIRRLVHPPASQRCFVCHKPIQPSEERLRLHHDTVVHRRCATYRMRNGHGFPG